MNAKSVEELHRLLQELDKRTADADACVGAFTALAIALDLQIPADTCLHMKKGLFNVELTKPGDSKPLDGLGWFEHKGQWGVAIVRDRYEATENTYGNGFRVALRVSRKVVAWGEASLRLRGELFRHLELLLTAIQYNLKQLVDQSRNRFANAERMALILARAADEVLAEHDDTETHEE